MTSPTRQSTELMRYIAMLAAREPAGGLLELRYRNHEQPGRMHQRFHHLVNTGRIARHILTLAEHSDVYIGVAPRRIPQGGRHAIHRGWVLWADLDHARRSGRRDELPVPPGVIIASGSPGHQHLYWPLSEPLDPAALERANATLAAWLGADTGAVLGVATILRPPHTRNHKHQPASLVTVERLELRAHSASEILAGLPEPHRPPARRAARRVGEGTSDPLQQIAPADYVHALTGETVGRDRKISCPLHADKTPSLHVYEAPKNGWWCYGCARGGDVYDLAGAIWQLDTRGSAFLDIRRRLTALLQPERPVEAMSARR